LRSDEASLFVRDGGMGKLSGKAMVALLRAVTENGKPFRFKASGFSMYPFIRNQDILTISPLPPGYPRFGNVVAFLHPETGKLVVHRVVGRMGDSYLTKGDNSSELDGLISESSILGYVTNVEREGRSISLCLGPERALIAFLSHKNLLCPALHLSCGLLCPLLRRIKT
jgi:hypothetical protein